MRRSVVHVHLLRDTKRVPPEKQKRTGRGYGALQNLQRVISPQRQFYFHGSRLSLGRVTFSQRVDLHWEKAHLHRRQANVREHGRHP